jgi:HSP20 family protein
MNKNDDNGKIAVYPGEFDPRISLEDVAFELNREHEPPITEPRANVVELEDCFRIEMMIPGVKSEDFFIKVVNNIISVTALRRKEGGAKKESFQLHEFDKECFHRDIVLPGNVDPNFVSAEYCDGMLYIYLRKNGNQLRKAPARIVVY